MLRYLVEHPGRLVTKAELRQHVWAGTHVTDTVLRVCVQEIRAALGDAAAAPQYLETVGRQGYRFRRGRRPDAAHSRRPDPSWGASAEVEALERVVPACRPGRPPARLCQWRSGDWQDDGGRSVAGPPGCRERGADGAGTVRRALWRGGTVPASLGGVGQLSRGPNPQEVLTALRRYAPMWLVQLPGLLNETELERLQRQMQGATSARMLRELAEALEVLTADDAAGARARRPAVE